MSHVTIFSNQNYVVSAKLAESAKSPDYDSAYMQIFHESALNEFISLCLKTLSIQAEMNKTAVKNSKLISGRDDYNIICCKSRYSSIKASFWKLCILLRLKLYY